ncbi:MAG: hypothetical protein AAGH79_15990 [Bacteroidota bacterium]
MAAITKTPALDLLRIPLKSAEERNFGLSEMDFNEMVEAARQGDQKIFERTFLSHFKDCMLYLQQKDKIGYQAAYDVTMDTLLLFRDLLLRGKIRYGNLRYLFTLMARQELYRQRKKAGHLISLPYGTEYFPEESLDISEKDYTLLTRAYKSLGKECRHLLRDFYFQRRSLKEIALEQGRAAPAVRKQKSRCVFKLRELYYKFN